MKLKITKVGQRKTLEYSNKIMLDMNLEENLVLLGNDTYLQPAQIDDSMLS